MIQHPDELEAIRERNEARKRWISAGGTPPRIERTPQSDIDDLLVFVGELQARIRMLEALRDTLKRRVLSGDGFVNLLHDMENLP